jgi:hypothetical protein
MILWERLNKPIGKLLAWCWNVKQFVADFCQCVAFCTGRNNGVLVLFGFFLSNREAQDTISSKTNQKDVYKEVATV